MDEIYTDKPSSIGKLSLAAVRYYLPLSALIMVLIIGTGYLFLLKPKYTQLVAGGNYDQDKLQAGLAKRQAYLADLQKLNDNYRKINQSEIERLKKILPSEADIAGLFSSMQQVTAQNGILLVSINISEAVEAAPAAKAAAPAGDDTDVGSESAAAARPATPALSSNIGKLNITLNLQGSENNYVDIKRFLTALESNLRLFDVNAVYFSPGTPTFTVNLTTYYAKK